MHLKNCVKIDVEECKTLNRMSGVMQLVGNNVGDSCAYKYENTQNGIRLESGADPFPAVRTTKDIKSH